MGKVSDLKEKGASYNPRRITDQQLENLKKSLEEFGDLSGIVFNVRTKTIVGGHQRIKQLDPSWSIVKSDFEDKTGTVSIGYIDTPFGRLVYREVDWPLQKEVAANIAANKHGGDWDFPKLKDLLTELDTGAFPLDLIGFSQAEAEKLFFVPDDFQSFDENIETTNECPQCHFKW